MFFYLHDAIYLNDICHTFSPSINLFKQLEFIRNLGRTSETPSSRCDRPNLLNRTRYDALFANSNNIKIATPIPRARGGMLLWKTDRARQVTGNTSLLGHARRNQTNRPVYVQRNL